MRSHLTSAVACASILLVADRSLAQEQDLTPSETIQLLEAVEKLRDGVDEARYGIHGSALTAFREASASTTSAYDFYMDCYKLVNFERRDARESEWREWRQRNVEYVRSKEHSEARRLQLHFLVLTLHAAQLKKPGEVEKLVPELTTLIDNAIARYPDLGRSRQILHESAVSSVFGQAYELGGTLKGLKNWGSAPLDVGGIYEKTILPLYRSVDRATKLGEVWDKRIGQRTKMVAALDNPEAEERFLEKERPQLLWAKYTDLLQAGRRRTALTEMVALAKKHPDHDSIDAWLENLQAWLSGVEEPTLFGAGADGEGEASE